MRVGITGGIGSGKSVVSRILKLNGFQVFNSDEAAKEIINTNKKVRREIVELFGDRAFLDGKYNAPFIAQKIFSSPEDRNNLNAIIHPEVRAQFELLANSHPLVFNEAAIFFETGKYKEFDQMILVTAPKEVKITRIQKRDGLTEEQIEQRMKAQWSDEEKRKLSDFEIKNDDLHSVLEQLDQILEKITL